MLASYFAYWTLLSIVCKSCPEKWILHVYKHISSLFDCASMISGFLNKRCFVVLNKCWPFWKPSWIFGEFYQLSVNVDI